jgi:hypothetical protein
MPPLNDPERLGCYRNALANWRYEGFITFTRDAFEWLRKELGDYSTREIARLMYESVAANGEIDEQREKREQWREVHEYHYDLRLAIAGRRIYFETRLIYRNPNDPDDPTIDGVNIHDV